MPKPTDKLKLALQSVVGKRMPDVNAWQTTLAIFLNASNNEQNTISSIASKALLTKKEVADALKILINSGFKMVMRSDGSLVFDIGNGLKYKIEIPMKDSAVKETGSTEIFIKNNSKTSDSEDDVNDPLMDGLIVAINKKDLKVIEKIITENEVDWNYSDSTNTSVLSKACEKNNINILTRLIEKGLLPQSGLMWACQNGNKYRGLIAFFIKHGASANVGESLMPLQWAIFTGAIGVAQELIENGADVDFISDNGEPILQMAIDSDNKQVVELLLMRGVNMDVVNSTGDNPLHWAVIAGSIDMVKMLIFANCPLDVKNYAGKTPQQLATTIGKESVVRVFELHQKS